MLKLLKHLKPYSLPIAAVFVLVFAQSMAELYLPNLMSDIVNHGITNGDVSYIIRTGGFMLLVALGGSVCAILSGYLSSPTSPVFPWRSSTSSGRRPSSRETRTTSRRSRW
jgi:ATP-binding cassette subfamily B multidrug efflux pump